MTSHYHHTKHATDVSQTATNHDEASQCWLSRVKAHLNVSTRRSHSKRVGTRISETSQERRDTSLTGPVFDTTALSTSDIETASEKGKTVLYLAYGSNLCNETFRGMRGIKPLSQINVLVPSLRLTFDLPGVPYVEPCFGNTAMRDPDAADSADYHKNRWRKGLVGCVYEVTLSDYAHIIATEGGGSGYQDILVDCYPLPAGDIVPERPTTQRFAAHTLFAPAAKAHVRPDPSYAQPSARYLNLIATGAAELNLPREYQNYLKDIRTYTITTRRQQIGKMLFTSIWQPFIYLLFALSDKFKDDKGRSPPWLAMLTEWLFLGMWRCYDGLFKRVFGDGERTEGLGEGESEMNEKERRRVGEGSVWFCRSRTNEDLV